MYICLADLILAADSCGYDLSTLVYTYSNYFVVFILVPKLPIHQIKNSLNLSAVYSIEAFECIFFTHAASTATLTPTQVLALDSSTRHQVTKLRCVKIM